MNAVTDNNQPWSREEFEEKLRTKGQGYHIYHPIHVAMYEGKLSKEQLQAWVANRFYYQIGIPLKEHENMFKKFYRASNAREVHASGTGLGLYFSKLIVERHDGKIWFESLEGSGTTFFVSLPKKQINEKK